jgi:hypothetical protein
MAPGTPQGSLRQRNVPRKSQSPAPPTSQPDDAVLEDMQKASPKTKPAGSDTEYKVTLAIITALGFLTRFWGISHPNEVVFDEVHFGKVSNGKGISVLGKRMAADLFCHSLRRTIWSGHTFSTCTRRLESCSSP